ncbi:hypothetical protein [Streptomyces sp. NPDC048309]|uniref:hypothetical protein n=1 Tax=Streptomyces sp. NPDC048309 TaxID=3154618 RepID=UPI00340046BE
MHSYSQAPESTKPSFIVWAAATLGITGLIATSYSTWLDAKTSEREASRIKNGQESALKTVDWSGPLWVFLGILALTAIAFIFYMVTRRKYMKNQNIGFEAALKAREEYHRQALEKLRKTTELATLMELNQGQIGDYHKIVTVQADKAFKSSRMAMGVGLSLLVCAAFGGAYVSIEEVRWFIGALAAFSTMLSGYISKTYFALYRDSISQLNRYFDQPVLNSYYLTAERLTHGLNSDQVTEVRRQIINEVLATSSRMGTTDAAPDPKQVPMDSKLRKKQTPKKRVPKKRVPKQAAAPPNGR